MSKSVGRKDNFGKITTKLLEDVISTDKRDTEGNFDISKSGKRALKTKHGRTLLGLGKRVTTSTTLKKSNSLRDVDMERIIKNSGNRHIMYKQNVDLRFSKYDSNVKNRLHRYFYNSVKHLTALRKKNALTPAHFAKEIENTISHEFGTFSKFVSKEGHDRLNEYKEILKNVVDLQMSHYSKGSGKRNLTLNNLVKVSTVIDEIVSNVALSAEKDGNDFRCKYIEDIGEWIQDLKKNNGHNNVNDILTKTYKDVLKKRGEDAIKNKALPESEEELLYAMRKIKEGIIEQNIQQGANININTNTLLQQTVYNNLLDRVAELPLPLSHNVAEQLCDKINLLRKNIGLDGNIQIEDILPEGAVSSDTSREKVGAQNTIAHSYINFIDVVTQRMYGNFETKQNTEKTLESIRKYFPEMQSFLQFTNLVGEYIAKGKEYEVSAAIEKGEQERKDFTPTSYFMRNVARSALECVDDNYTNDAFKTQYNDDLKKVLQGVEKNITKTIDTERGKSITTTLQERVLNDSTNVHAIRMKRFGKGIYNVAFGKTLVGQAVRTTAKLGLLAGSGALIGLSLPAILVQSGGNALLAAILALEVKKFGVAMAIASPGILSWFISPLRKNHSNRSVRKLTTIKEKGPAQSKAKIFGGVEYKHGLQKKEQIRIQEYNNRDRNLEKTTQNIYTIYKVLENNYNKERGKGTYFPARNPHTSGTLDTVYNNVRDVLSNSQKTGNDAIALYEIQRGSLLMKGIRDVDDILNEQERDRKLLHNNGYYQWNEAIHPAVQIPRKELAQLTKGYLISRILSDVDGSTTYKEHLKYSTELLGKRLSHRIGNVDAESLVSALDEEGIEDVKKVLSDFRTCLLPEYNKSSFSNAVTQALKTVKPDSWDTISKEIAPLKKDVSFADEVDMSTISSRYTVPQKEMSTITKDDIDNAIAHQSFCQLFNQSLQLYAPYTNKNLIRNDIQHIFNLLDTYIPNRRKNYKGSFVTEILPSILHMISPNNEGKNIANLILEQSVKIPEGREMVLRDDIELDNDLLKDSSNNVVKNARNPKEGLLGQLKMLYSTELGSLKPTKKENFMDVLLSITNPRDLLTPDLLKRAEKENNLIPLVHRLINLMLPNNHEQGTSPVWIKNLYGTLNVLNNQWKAKLRGLITAELEHKILQQLPEGSAELYVLADAIVNETCERTRDGNGLEFKNDVIFDKNLVKNRSDVSDVWSADNVSKQLSGILQDYLQVNLPNVEEETELSDKEQYLLQVKNTINLDDLLTNPMVERARNVSSLGALANKIYQTYYPSNGVGREDPVWIKNMFAKVNGLQSPSRDELRGLLTSHIEYKVLRTLNEDNNKSKELKLLTETLLKETANEISARNYAFKNDVVFNKNMVEGLETISDIWNNNDIPKLLMGYLRFYLLKKDPVQLPSKESMELKGLKRSDSIDIKTKKQLEDLSLQERKYFNTLYNNVVAQFNKIKEMLPADKQDSVTETDPINTIEIISIYAQIMSMDEWSNLPGEYNPALEEKEKWEHIKKMRTELNQILIASRLHLSTEKGKEVYFDGEKLLRNIHTFKEVRNKVEFLQIENPNLNVATTFEKWLQLSLTEFVGLMNKMNTERYKRQVILSKKGKRVDLQSIVLKCTGVIQSLIDEKNIGNIKH